jgi:hypothetical protein
MRARGKNRRSTLTLFASGTAKSRPECGSLGINH